MAGTPSTLIITNGDSAADLLREAGVQANILPWRDVLHVGPVPLTPTLEQLSAIRARYLTDGGLAYGKETQRAFLERDAKMRNLKDHSRIELWFEHDLYDQLQLMQIMDFLTAGRPACDVVIVQSANHLTDYTPETVLQLNASAAPVTPAHFDIAARVWGAFRRASPDALALELDAPLPLFPHAACAIERMLQELPNVGTGLSRTQTAVLNIVHEQPASSAVDLFRAVSEREQAAFMGDSVFWKILDGLNWCSRPLISGLPEQFAPNLTPNERRSYFGAPVTLTVFGEQVLSGEQDHATHNAVDLWLGGTHVTDDNLWRWDPDGRALAAPL
jgi:hypothetical protein